MNFDDKTSNLFSRGVSRHINGGLINQLCPSRSAVCIWDAVQHVGEAFRAIRCPRVATPPALLWRWKPLCERGQRIWCPTNLHCHCFTVCTENIHIFRSSGADFSDLSWITSLIRVWFLTTRLQMTVLRLWCGTWVPTVWSWFFLHCWWPWKKSLGELKQASFQ